MRGNASNNRIAHEKALPARFPTYCACHTIVLPACVCILACLYALQVALYSNGLIDPDDLVRDILGSHDPTSTRPSMQHAHQAGAQVRSAKHVLNMNAEGRV